ncbi:MAG: hypothetical protein EZS28_018428 [Streblomastix strix]|uniref:Uncharacterized protein n=1 Tax=Streblomastix strix TaxID=222440 RepID=A0A5J4VUC3_9EUKA|nr:MAG: hypothetical protein EZS28_018428 [Streblomastix strix]
MLQGMKDGTSRKQLYYCGFNPNDLIQDQNDLDEHIRGVHDPIQGENKDIAMREYPICINARAIEVFNEIVCPALPTESQRLPYTSSRDTAPPKDYHKDDDLMQFIPFESVLWQETLRFKINRIQHE